MFLHFKTVVFKVDEFGGFVFVMWDTCGKDGNAGIGSDAVKGVFVQGNDAFKRVFFENVFFNCLFFFGFSRHGRLRHNHNGFAIFC